MTRDRPLSALALLGETKEVGGTIKSILPRTDSFNGSYWRYQYDTLGQVTSGKHYWSDTVPVAGQQFEYTHDTIGNRTQAKFGGDQTGGNLQQATYVPNLLNQYNNRSVPSGISIDGNAHASAVVTVNSQSAYRKGEECWKEITVANNSVEVWANAQIQAALSGTTITNIGNKFVPKTPEIFGYDADGNLLNDGRWNYTWDAENRLIRMISRSTTVDPQQRLDFEYDYMGRRIRKKVWENTSGSGNPGSDLKFLYDGWNLIAELNGTTGAGDAVVRTYIWGIDLSGSYQGAGGVGGLLGVKLSNGSGHFAAYDGNGNISGYVDGTSGQYSPNYEYGPFGEPIRVSVSLGKDIPFRFSSKLFDSQTELVYYGHRFYSPNTGRWLSRDPVEERGGRNLFAHANNDNVNNIDFLGLFIELWYGNHLVEFLGMSGFHSKLWLITDEAELVRHAGSQRFTFFPVLSKTKTAGKDFIGACNLYALAIGAGPDQSPDELWAQFNRRRDIELDLFNPELVTSFSSMPDAIRFLNTVQNRNTIMNQNFINTTLEYDVDVDYSYISTFGWDEFNSNSYVSGLLRSLGYRLPIVTVSAPGYRKPLPNFVFTTSFASSEQLRKAWKLAYPGF